ncbi:acetyl-CoA synthetase-like protein [Mollisia scopiformis]|uniref:Acetyl-CoA synthetase-like protein n=1 Tax=Mollisia scopiformis TaxID=149040 RepID=A0A194XER0_MOLSC|nr:acetyl-CoA synthetase-like protein [Mollisia scopiformis]KUJ18636.1 acetyl-CoA synthetase-like protein [Mollisia scopiformis]
MLGKRLLPHVVDHIASTNPNLIIGMVAKASAGEKTPYDFTEVNMFQFANAVNYTAHWLDSILGPGSQQTIGFVGLQDFRYAIMEVAAIKTRNVLLLPSPRNALSNTIHLLNATECGSLFYSGTGSPIENHVKGLQDSMGTDKLKLHAIPSFEDMVSTPAPHYSYTKTYKEAKNDVVLILHTSGSTGRPKPIRITNAYIKRADSEQLTPTIPNRIHADLRNLQSPMYNGSPFFHLSGVIVMLRALFSGVNVVIGPPDVPPTPKVACNIARSIELKTVMAAPHVVDSLFLEHGEELKERFSKLEHVIWFGGPLAHTTGDWIINHLPHVHLWQFYGSTEMAWFPMLVAPKTHWSYMEFHPHLGPHLEPVPDTDLHELVIRHREDPTHAWSTPIFDIFPDEPEWRSRDLFKRCQDPGMQNLWKFESRLDDIMILNNALKVNPLHIEVKLQSHALLNGAMVFGEGRMKCGILLEPKQGIEKELLLRIVWGDIERANGDVPEHARVERHLVLVADKEKPFVKSAKGTVVRAATGKLYEREIEEVYLKAIEV